MLSAIRRAVGVLTVAAAVTVSWSALGPAAARTCPTVTTTTVIPSPGIDGWAENVFVDADGSIWVSRSLRNVVQRYDATGVLTASVPVAAPGSIRRAPDGMLYVASGDTPLNMIPTAPRTGQVMRFDPRARQPIPRTFASGLGMPNGLAIDSHGTVYVADGVRGLLRLNPDGSVDERWSAAAPHNLAPSATVDGTGINGLTVVGDDLYVTLTSSATGRVLRVPIGNPAATAPAADLTAPLPGVLDDVAALNDTTLAVASTTGTMYLVDLGSPTVCAAGIGVPLTALAVEPSGTMLATSETGQVLRVTLR